MEKFPQKLLELFLENFPKKNLKNFFDLFFKNILQNKIKLLYLYYGVAIRATRTSHS